MEKIAIVFPGIGYGVQKPLLYYAIRIAKNRGYRVVCIEYSDMPAGVKDDRMLIQEAVRRGLQSAIQQTKGIDFGSFERILIIGKSIGTVIGAEFIEAKGISAKHIWFTPVELFFSEHKKVGYVFHGTNDPWINTKQIIRECERMQMPLRIFEGANHSLEIGDPMADMDALISIMKSVYEYIS